MSSPADLSLRQRAALRLYGTIRHNRAKMHELRTLFWECTLRCNMNCRHCGSDCKQAPAVPDMPAAVFLKAIDDITPHVDPHKTFITFTGGEALVRDDIEEVGLELYRRGFPWGMVTNGLLLDERRLDSLLRSGMHSITISFDGFEEDHNWIRRNEHSFERAAHAIKLLVQTSDLVWDIVTCVNPRNYGRLEEFKEYLISIGVRDWRLFSIFPMGRAAQNPELQLSDAQFRGLFEFIKKTRAEGRIRANYGCEGFLGPYEGEVRDYYFHCRAGVEVASVLCDGSISGCKAASRSIVTIVGPRKASAPAAICGATARAAACISTTIMSSCFSVITTALWVNKEGFPSGSLLSLFDDDFVREEVARLPRRRMPRG